MAMLQFVILHHEGVEPAHFDLMFETYPGSKLATWRASAWPFDQSAKLTQLDDHRRDFLTYEGPLSQARGYVRRVMAGRCRIELRNPADWFVYFPHPGGGDAPPSAFRMQQVEGENWKATPVGG